MSQGLIDYNTLTDISDAIREKTNSSSYYYPREMATAIRSIKSGGGFPEPVVYSIKAYTDNIYDNHIIDRYNFVGFEIANELPNNAEIIDYNAEWGSLSPDQVIFYRRWENNIECERRLYDGQTGNYYYGNVNNVNGWFYGMCVPNTYTNQQCSVIDLANMAYYSSNFSFAYCGDYTVSMDNAYACCYNLTEAVCGPRVEDMSSAYYCCYNLKEAVTGENVKKMYNTYRSCNTITTAAIGPLTTNISHCYSDCANLTGDIEIHDLITDGNSAFYNCQNINSFYGTFCEIKDGTEMFQNCYKTEFNNVHLNALKNGVNMFYNCKLLTDVDYLESVENAANMFYECSNLENVNHADYSNLLNAYGMFWNTKIGQDMADYFMQSFASSVEDTFNNSSLELQNVFYNCGSINRMYISNRFNYDSYRFTNIYRNCPIDDVYFEDNVTVISKLFQDMNFTQASCPDSVIEMAFAYNNCKLLGEGYMGMNVRNAYGAFMNCDNIVNAYIGPSVVNAGYAYANCRNAYGSVEFPENTNYIYGCLMNCNNISSILLRFDLQSVNSYTVNNAFYRNNYAVRRNVVALHSNTFNYITSASYRAFGSGVYFTTENYDTPINVMVNGINYSVNKCAYNLTMNTYVYCAV